MYLLYKLSYLNSNFALTLGYLNPALNNPAQISVVTRHTYVRHFAGEPVMTPKNVGCFLRQHNE